MRFSRQVRGRRGATGDAGCTILADIAAIRRESMALRCPLRATQRPIGVHNPPLAAALLARRFQTRLAFSY